MITPPPQLQRLVSRLQGNGIARAVVTGAAGFIGSTLSDALLEQGTHVVGIDSFTPYYAPTAKHANLAAAAKHRNFELLAGDLNELDLEEVLRPGDVVFHMAGQPGVRASWGSGFFDYTRLNIDATQRVLEAARRSEVARVVLASSSSVYGDAPLPMSEDGPVVPVSPYGLTKLAAEQLALVYWKNFGLEVVPLRFFTVYGPRQRPDMAFNLFLDALLEQRPLTVYGDGSQVRDFTFVDDVVRASLAAATRARPGQPVNVGGGSPVSVRQAIAILEELLGRRAQLEFEPAPPGDARNTQADYSRLSLLGVRPRVGIEEGLRRQVEWRLQTVESSSVRTKVGRGSSQRPLCVLYSHDTYGLGHLRRNSALAHALLKREPGARVVLITGSPVAGRWPMPAGVEVIKLPPVVKQAAESYTPLDSRSLAGLLAERAGIISSALLRLRPHAFLVDHAPLGLKGELRLALDMARAQLPETRRLLGLRDILDDPAEVRKLWQDQGTLGWIESSYDGVLVYGSRELFDVGEAYGFGPQLAARTRYTGYIAKDRGMEPELEFPVGVDEWLSGDLRILVTGGGGGDAGLLFSAFLEAWPSINAALPVRALLVTGPLMDEETMCALEEGASRLAGVDLIRSSNAMLSLVDATDVVVSMGGYNSVVEAVTARKRLVICPRVWPRREQLIRAEAFSRLGLARSVRVEEAGAGGLAKAVRAAIERPLPPAKAWAKVDLGGGDRVTEELVELVGALQRAG
jgi:predicted glycosyltransferase/nucleoside-diphosphate-sugar epimerase